jgi:hypothetical protein
MAMKIITTILVTAALSLFSLGANAAWTCKVSNHKHQTWEGSGTTRALALETAVGACSKNTPLARDCAIRACHQQ